MTTVRQKDTTSRQGTTITAASADALASLRKLRNKTVRVTVSNSADRDETYAEFELPMSDAVVSALDSYLQAQRSNEPNARLAAALDEAGRMKARFSSARELFDALEKKGQG